MPNAQTVGYLEATTQVQRTLEDLHKLVKSALAGLSPTEQPARGAALRSLERHLDEAALVARIASEPAGV